MVNIKIKKNWKDPPCTLHSFKVNDKKADINEFGKMKDVCPKKAGPYECGNMKFLRKIYPKDIILKKYGLDLSDYDEVCIALEKEMKIGNCGWCV